MFKTLEIVQQNPQIKTEPTFVNSVDKISLKYLTTRYLTPDIFSVNDPFLQLLPFSFQ